MKLHIHMYICLCVCICNSMHLSNYLGVSSLPAVSKEIRNLPSITRLENVLHLSFFFKSWKQSSKFYLNQILKQIVITLSNTNQSVLVYRDRTITLHASD